MIMPLGWAVKDGGSDVSAFAFSMAAGSLLSLILLGIGYMANAKDMGTREAFASVSLS